MISLQELELVFRQTDGQWTDGWTDRRDVGNSILDFSNSLSISVSGETPCLIFLCWNVVARVSSFLKSRKIDAAKNGKTFIPSQFHTKKEIYIRSVFS